MNVFIVTTGYIIISAIVSALVCVLAPIGYKLGLWDGMTEDLLKDMMCWLIGIFWPISIPFVIISWLLYITFVKPIIKFGDKVEKRVDEYLEDKKAKSNLKSKVDKV